ncbi:MAG TPA: ATP-binding protein [Aggregatilinea sp.]|uniref:sensor histidine kinase n=1 Tax=Aggregatilinea sp. TaxID=2806333 RepID=UPI002BCC611B|nr:ATP-binding protein [Aggregatilinea sp.]HML21781.1 ATP-binding protein [Aggregatilinea sp.]
MPLENVQPSSLESLCRSVSDVVVACDGAGRVVMFNPAAETAFHTPAAGVVGRTLDNLPALEPIRATLLGYAGDGSTEVRNLILPGGAIYQGRVIAVEEIGRVAILASAVAPDDRAKGQLALQMGTIIHTLKTPIASAHMALDVVLAAGSLNARQDEFTRRAQHTMDHMLRIVSELVDMTWLEAGEDLQLDEVELNELADAAIDQLKSDRIWRGVAVELLPAPDGCRVMADERRLSSAIVNLVSNAIKYSPNGGTVRVRIDSAPEAAVVAVEDEGIGIAPEHIPYIFDWFYRVVSTETRRIEGSGLGLAIVKAIVEKHGGEVAVESKPGRGSTFRFTVPAREP